MIFRLFPTKDTFITNVRVNDVAQTASNLGASEILHVFRVAPVGNQSGSLGRILSRFDVSGVPALTASLSSGSVSFKLRMKNARHAETLPSSFDLEVMRVTTDWDEGRGHDADLFVDRGFANWDKAKSNVLWNTAGGDYDLTGSAVVHFDVGDEDLVADVTTIANQWIVGSAQNYGLMVRMSSSFESSSTDYYVKKFHSRETHFPDYRPYLEVAWDDSVQGATGSATIATGSGPYVVNVTNIKNSYERDEVVRMRLFVRPFDYNPAVVLTASLGPSGQIVSQAFYRIVNDRTNEVVVPFGTGSTKTTRLSYDDRGNYFDFYMSTLPENSVYRLSFLFNIGSQQLLIDEGFKFKVV